MPQDKPASQTQQLVDLAVKVSLWPASKACINSAQKIVDAGNFERCRQALINYGREVEEDERPKKYRAHPHNLLGRQGKWLMYETKHPVVEQRAVAANGELDKYRAQAVIKGLKCRGIEGVTEAEALRLRDEIDKIMSKTFCHYRKALDQVAAGMK